MAPNCAPGRGNFELEYWSLLMSHRMEIRRAESEDAATFTEIAFAAKRHWGYPEQWIQDWKGVLTIRSELIANHEVFIAWVEGQAVGFYVLAGGAKRRSLEHLWVLPRAMGLGI